MATNLTLPVVEFEHVALPAHLDGRDGDLRGTGLQTIGANNDVDAVRIWLSRLRSPHTIKAYKKEVERLLLWVLDVRGIPLSSLREEDFRAYQKFTVNPQPRDRWCGTRGPRRGAINEWKPFVTGLSPKSQAHAMGVIRVLMTYLHQTGYLAVNAMAGYKIDRPDKAAEVERYLSRDMVLAMFDAIEAMPKGSDEAVAEYERARFLLRLLYVCAPRAAEVVKAGMGDIYYREKRWWWRIVGKAGAERRVPFTPMLIKSLGRYRQARGLQGMPLQSENVPLIASVRGGGWLTGTDPLRQVILDIGRRVALALPNDPRGLQVAQASTHWMRHTGGTHMLRAGMSLPQVQAILGHKDISTTGLYQHNEQEALHDELSERFSEFIPA